MNKNNFEFNKTEEEEEEAEEGEEEVTITYLRYHQYSFDKVEYLTYIASVFSLKISNPIIFTRQHLNLNNTYSIVLF